MPTWPHAFARRACVWAIVIMILRQAKSLCSRCIGGLALGIWFSCPGLGSSFLCVGSRVEVLGDVEFRVWGSKHLKV